MTATAIRPPPEPHPRAHKPAPYVPTDTELREAVTGAWTRYLQSLADLAPRFQQRRHLDDIRVCVIALMQRLDEADNRAGVI